MKKDVDSEPYEGFFLRDDKGAGGGEASLCLLACYSKVTGAVPSYSVKYTVILSVDKIPQSAF